MFDESKYLFTAVPKVLQDRAGQLDPLQATSCDIEPGKDARREHTRFVAGMRIRRDFPMIDLARMWHAGTRLPDQWSDDNLAALAAARVVGQRLTGTIRTPSQARLVDTGRSDQNRMILRYALARALEICDRSGAGDGSCRNPSDTPCPSVHLNTLLGGATSPLIGALFNALDEDMPHNAPGSRRLRFTCPEETMVPGPTFRYA